MRSGKPNKCQFAFVIDTLSKIVAPNSFENMEKNAESMSREPLLLDSESFQAAALRLFSDLHDGSPPISIAPLAPASLVLAVSFSQIPTSSDNICVLDPKTTWLA